MTAGERRPPSVRHPLVLLALAVAIPLVGLAFYVSYRVAAIEQEATRAALLNNARSLAAALDQEIDKHIAVASTLARSPSLLHADWPEFQQWAKESLADLQGSGLIVLDPTGQVLTDTSAAPDAALPRRPLFAVEEQALRTGKAEVSGIVTGFAADRMVAFAAIPVFRDGQPLYVVDIVLNPDRFVALLQEQNFLLYWLAAIVDGNGNFVARLPDEAGTKLGRSASEGWRDAIRQSPTGVVEHISTDGQPIIDAYTKASHGWTVGIGIRQSILAAPFRGTLWLLLAASLGCIGLGLVFSWLVAHRLNRSAQVLHGAAKTMAAEQPVRAVPTGVIEYDEAVGAFAAASPAPHARRQGRARAEQALRAHEAELEAVINRTPFMLTRCSRDLRYRFVSQGCAEMLGRNPEDIVGRPIAEIVGEEAFKAMLPSITRVLNGERVETEREIHFQGIGARFVHVVDPPERDEHGEVVGWVASILDITDRKRAERDRQRAEAALAASADAQTALYEFTNRLYRAESLKVAYEAGLDAIVR